MVTVKHDEKARQFTTELDGHGAHLDYTLAGNVMTITHTRVPQAIGGRGVAAELMRAALGAARTAGWAVNPACSYAAGYMRRHAQDADQAALKDTPAVRSSSGGGQTHIDDLLDEALDESFPASDSPAVGGSS
jgi:predicted GNAT family acetyltransferase